MSLNCNFSYSILRSDKDTDTGNAFEVEEVNTQYLNWMFELMPEDYKRVEGFAPFLQQIYDAFEDEEYPAQTDPFEPEQARTWAARWLELWQADTGDEGLEAVKQEWAEYSERTIQDLHQIIEQADCAKQHGVLLEFGMG